MAVSELISEANRENTRLSSEISASSHHAAQNGSASSEIAWAHLRATTACDGGGAQWISAGLAIYLTACASAPPPGLWARELSAAHMPAIQAAHQCAALCRSLGLALIPACAPGLPGRSHLASSAPRLQAGD